MCQPPGLSTCVFVPFSVRRPSREASESGHSRSHCSSRLTLPPDPHSPRRSGPVLVPSEPSSAQPSTLSGQCSSVFVLSQADGITRQPLLCSLFHPDGFAGFSRPSGHHSLLPQGRTFSFSCSGTFPPFLRPRCLPAPSLSLAPFPSTGELS